MTNVTLKNVTLEGQNASIMVEFENGETRNYRYPVEEYSLAKLASDVIAQINAFNSIEAKFAPIKSLVGKTFQLVNGNLSEVK
jgi:hypothetical protein